MLDKKHIALSGRLVIVGFGSIGQGVLPLLLRHLEIAPDQITIITAEPHGHDVAAEYGIRFLQTPLTQINYRAILEPHLGDGDFLLNVSVDVSSVALIALCQQKGALYLDTCIEPWPGGYTDPGLSPSARSNGSTQPPQFSLSDNAHKHVTFSIRRMQEPLASAVPRNHQKRALSHPANRAATCPSKHRWSQISGLTSLAKSASWFGLSD